MKRIDPESTLLYMFKQLKHFKQSGTGFRPATQNVGQFSVHHSEESPSCDFPETGFNPSCMGDSYKSFHPTECSPGCMEDSGGCQESAEKRHIMKNADLTQHWLRIINTMNEGLMLVSPDGSILMVNHSFEQLTGYPAEEIVGNSCKLLGCDACESMLTPECKECCNLFLPNHGDIRQCRCVIIRKDGALLSVLKNASVLRDESGKMIGAVETITDLTEIDHLDQKVGDLSRQLIDTDYSGIIGTSAAMRKVFQLIEKAAHSDAPIIILGESGTGKELVAQAIHNQGLRKNGPYVQLNCAALNASLLESELFGHIKGAFTGAYRHRVGRFETAHGGDIFLDEIGDMPLSMQVKLLRVLETKQFERVGDHRPITVDVRIISATNKNLPELIDKGLFREDLYFRINVIPICLPPLRERKEDIPILVSSFIRQLNSKTDKNIQGLSVNAMKRFMEYSWPGNIREMKSALEYAFVIAESRWIDLEHLPLQFESAGQTSRPPEKTDASIEKSALIEALRQSNGNQTHAARILGINRVTVWNRMRKYHIDLKEILSG
jgi:PAS domain S-box-containing protein